VLDTEAQIALARGEPEEALQTLAEAARAAERDKNPEAVAAIHHTRARVLAAQGQTDQAVVEFGRAAEAYRELGFTGRLRPVLSEWAELFGQIGKPAEAVELYREALALKPRQ
jgi:tetratricopeptide (TPR) repeat protein